MTVVDINTTHAVSEHPGCHYIHRVTVTIHYTGCYYKYRVNSVTPATCSHCDKIYTQCDNIYTLRATI